MCSVPDLEAASRDALASAADARARLPHVEELGSLQAAADRILARRTTTLAALERLERRASVLPEELERSRAAEASASRADDGLAAARTDVEATAERLAAATLVATLLTERSAAEARHRQAVDIAQARKERWLHLQEQRLEGMAAEIAGALAVGACCPVCGSADHPQPARPSPGAPDASAERSARRAVDDAEAERHARSLAVQDLQTRLDLARDRSGHRTVPVVEREHAAAAAALARLEEHSARLPAAVRVREALEAEQAGLGARRSTLATDAGALEARNTDLTRRAERLAEELADVLAGSGHDSVTALADHLDGVATACRAAVAAGAARDRARTHAADTAARAAGAARDQGFSDEYATRAVALPSLLLERVEREVRGHESAVAAVTEALADPELTAAAAVAPPDLDALAARHNRLHDELTRARAAASVAERAALRLQRLRDDLDAALAAWAPARDELVVAERMASLADGSSPDNRLRMRLSAYVLAARLSQVVEAANERLARMFDHRYALAHSGERGVGETRGGLSLRVRDDWTGEARDPATLSGGETFVVSLALALGLADVIAHEAGGSDLDTLFVDEGFGSLDAETLDQVLDTLDSLRDGGRVVGVVSHVAEMQTRIPTQLHVSRRRVGSTLSQSG